MSEPLVSICCITYNHENLISDAIESFLMQKTRFPFEILIGEDCSRDGTRRVCQDYEKRFPEQIRVIARDVNIGGKQNLRDLFNQAKGRYIALCEGDDYWTDDEKLQKQVDRLESDSNCVMCFHASKVIRASWIPLERTIRAYQEDHQCSTEEVIELGSGKIPTQSKVFRRQAIQNMPSWYRNARVGDLATDLLLASQGSVAYLDEQMSVYRRGVKGSWSHKTYTGPKVMEMKQDSMSRCIEFYQIFDEATDRQYTQKIQLKTDLLETGLALLNEKGISSKLHNSQRMMGLLGFKRGGIISIKYIGLIAFAAFHKQIHHINRGRRDE